MISRDNVFKISYTSSLGEKNIKNERWTSKLKEFIKRNKIITMTAIIFGLCLVFNFVLIFNFMRILENM